MREPIAVRGALRIRGSGLATPTCPSPEGPKAIITNQDLAGILLAEESSERKHQAVLRMLQTQGCQSRSWSHWIGAAAAPDEMTTVDLAEMAADRALADADMDIAEVDMVILALSTSTLPTIATSTPLCDRLGFRGPSYDVKAGCAGGLYALQMAAAWMAAGYRRILVIGADTMSKYVDREALAGFANVGDGAGALVLERAKEANFVAVLDGEYASWDTAGVFGSLPPQAQDSEAFWFRGRPTSLREHIVQRYREGMADLLQHVDLGLDAVEWWVPHQIALPILQEVWAAFGVPTLRLFQNFDRYGNAGAASLFMALHEARGGLGSGWVALSALGGGMRLGAALWKEVA